MGGREVDFEILNRFQGGTELPVVGLARCCRSSDGIVEEQPIVISSLLDIIVVNHTEGKVKSWCHLSHLLLTKGIAHARSEARQGHLVAVAIGEAHLAHHHSQASCKLGCLVPLLVIKRFLRQDGKFQLQGAIHLREKLNLVVIHLFIFKVEHLAVCHLRRYDEALAVLTMLYQQGGIRQEGHFLLKSLLVLRQLLCQVVSALILGIGLGILAILSVLAILGIGAGKLLAAIFLSLFLRLLLFFLGFFLRLLLRLPLLLLHRQFTLALGTLILLVHFLEEWDVVVETNQVEIAVQGQFALAVDGIAIRVAFFIFHASLPRIVGAVVGIGVQPVEGWQQIERHLIRSGEVLTVVERGTPALHAVPYRTSIYRVFPGMILVGIEVGVHLRIRHIHLCMGSTLEVHVQVLGQVPAHGELSVPEELVAIGKRQLRIECTLHIALLQFVGLVCHLCIECHVLRQPVQAELLQNIEPLALVLDLLERLPRFIHRSPGIIQGATPVVTVLINRGLAGGTLMRMTVGQREVGRVIRHRMTLGSDTHTGVGN